MLSYPAIQAQFSRLEIIWALGRKNAQPLTNYPLNNKQILTLGTNWFYEAHVIWQMEACTHKLYYPTLQPTLQRMTSSACTLNLRQSNVMDQQQCQGGQARRDCIMMRMIGQEKKCFILFYQRVC